MESESFQENTPYYANLAKTERCILFVVIRAERNPGHSPYIFVTKDTGFRVCVRTANALYQGPTLVGPLRPRKNWALAPALLCRGRHGGG